MNNDTQPLTPEQAWDNASEGAVDLIGKAVQHAIEQYQASLSQDVHQALEAEHPHAHGPFIFLMNANHNALRGCVTCGQAWVGYMAGERGNLVWEPVAEVDEEEE